MLGKLLDRRYQVVKVLGAGGFGKTYLAEDTRRPGNPVCVVKQLKPASRDPEFLLTARRLFNSEAETLESLGHHQQIPRLLAYFEENQEFYLVQDFIDGPTLSQELIPGKKWLEAQVIDLLQDVLPILSFVHKQGVIHRDIKPDNLIRRLEDRHLVLVDFGAVKKISNQTLLVEKEVSQTIAVGTPGYMSSEQARGQPRPNSDIYSLGVVAIQALTGVEPAAFEYDQHTGEILWQHLTQVSPGLAAILSRMVMYHFRERYQRADEVLQRLEQLSNPYARFSQPASPLLDQQRTPPPVPRTKPQKVSPPPTYAPSRQQTLAVSPAGQQRSPSPSSYRTSSPPVAEPKQGDSAPILMLISIVLVLAAGGFGIVYALRNSPSIFASGGGLLSRNLQKCTVTAEPSLNVRSSPNGELLGQIDEGAKVSLTKNTQGKWVEISRPTKGWVYSTYLDCNTQETDSVANGEQNKESPEPKPSPPEKTKIVDNGKQILAAAQEKYQQGDLTGAVREALSIPPNSGVYREAQKTVQEWQRDWSEAEDKFAEAQAALEAGNWEKVSSLADSGGDNKYWQRRFKELAARAKQGQEEEAKEQKPPSEPEPRQVPPLNKEPKEKKEQPEPEPKEPNSDSQEEPNKEKEDNKDLSSLKPEIKPRPASCDPQVEDCQ